jgi:SEC-C motif-containing protein
MPKTPCPCTSGRALAECCGPHLAGAREAPDPEALMRSRFAAFATKNAEYLWSTLSPQHPDRRQAKEAILQELRKSARLAKFRRLEVLDQAPPDTGGVARVLFLATVFHDGRDRSFVELSDFHHDGTGWRYEGGLLRALVQVPGDARTLRIAGFLELVMKSGEA